MNAAPAIVGDTLYVGSRTEGGTHDDAGVLIVDIADPANPQVVGQIGPPDEALLGMTSRELRAVPDQNLLIVMNFACSTDIHACTRDTNAFGQRGTAERDNIKIYDVSTPHDPVLLSTTTFGPPTAFPVEQPHEFYLWRDPNDASRTLLFTSTPIGPPSVRVLDISDPENVATVTTFDAHGAGATDEPPSGDSLVHSISVTDDGGIAFLSLQGSGLALADTSQVAAGVELPEISLLTAAEDRIDYSPPAAPGTHSAVAIPGRDIALVTDEVYPIPYAAGCPWGWARFVDFSNPAKPAIVGEYRLAENDPTVCPANNGPMLVTYTAHNQTVTESLAVVTWHAGGILVLDTTDPTAPERLARFKPEPLPSVQTEDPALGGDPVLMWSYPIIKDGLIYVVDIRNGLYVLEYTGPHDDEIADAAFNEGNSNLR